MLGLCQGPATEKAVDCLRILTTGNDANKVALFSIPAAMPALVRLMGSADQVQLRVPELSEHALGKLGSSGPACTIPGSVQACLG